MLKEVRMEDLKATLKVLILGDGFVLMLSQMNFLIYLSGRPRFIQMDVFLIQSGVWLFSLQRVTLVNNSRWKAESSGDKRLRKEKLSRERKGRWREIT